MNEDFEISLDINLRNTFQKLETPFRKIAPEQIHSYTLLLHCVIKSQNLWKQISNTNISSTT